MALEMKVPSPGESITEVEIAQWLVEDGDYVEKDQIIAEVDSDKATLELPAEEAGIITLRAEEGDLVQVGGVVCLIDTDAEKPADFESKAESVSESSDALPNPGPTKTAVDKSVKATPVAKEMIAANDINPSDVQGSGSNGKITKKDIGLYLNGAEGKQGERKKMSMLRRKVAKRLVAVKNETAMLTTFNEVDMKPIMDIRAIYKEAFKEKHGVGLGFMSFFTKAVTNSLKEFPTVNSMMDGDYMVSYDFADIGIAVSSPKGLMVPVVREAQDMSLVEIETEIKRLAIKARDGKIDLADMEGGTFTITNGGVFGSMLSTPIINPPQSAILGMHNIVERPVAIEGKVEIRPIMFVALSYDHRIIDGKESVSFLKMIKEQLEDPKELILQALAPNDVFDDLKKN